jgi:hypothetical protein
LHRVRMFELRSNASPSNPLRMSGRPPAKPARRSAPGSSSPLALHQRLHQRRHRQHIDRSGDPHPTPSRKLDLNHAGSLGYRWQRREGRWCSRGDRSARCDVSLSAQILARPEPDRDALSASSRPICAFGVGTGLVVAGPVGAVVGGVVGAVGGTPWHCTVRYDLPLTRSLMICRAAAMSFELLSSAKSQRPSR